MSKKRKSRDRNKRIRIAHRKRHKADANQAQVYNALTWLVNEKIFTGIQLHGNTSWVCSNLVCLTLLWVWSTTPQISEAFVDARSKLEKLFGKSPVTTYQGLMKALVSTTPKLMPVLQKRLHQLMDKIGGEHMRIGRWVPIAIDGSKETAPRTVSNETAFRAKNYGQGKNAKNRRRKPRKASSGKLPVKAKKSKQVPLPPPQVWLTMMWHIGLGMPWCWKLGPSNASERNHVREMLKSAHFLANTLFVGDAGFVGYDFWKSMIDDGHHFLVRVGTNVNLLSDLCVHGRDGKDIVYCWPKKKMKANEPPLRLRLVKCKIGKNENVWLLTSVLDKRQLSNKDMVKLYKQRWGIELEFRALKQTFSRRKLRCRSAERVLVEIEWSIFGMAAVELMTLKEQLTVPGARPEKLSFAQALTRIRHSLNNLKDCPEFMNDLCTDLRAALIDDYERTKLKEGRYKPKKKNKPSCGEPVVGRATREQKHQYKLHLQNAA